MHAYTHTCIQCTGHVATVIIHLAVACKCVWQQAKTRLSALAHFFDLLQARSMAAKNARTARVGNIISGFLLMSFSIPFGLLGGEQAEVGRESSAAVT
jgi:hypothetical protein